MEVRPIPAPVSKSYYWLMASAVLSGVVAGWWLIYRWDSLWSLLVVPLNLWTAVRSVALFTWWRRLDLAVQELTEIHKRLEKMK